ncbi:hypothetical protein NKJ54_34205 [Mesorhizobium sp. M0098]
MYERAAWIRNNVPKRARADVTSVDEVAHKLIADARSIGINRGEVDSIYSTIRSAIVHYDPGLPNECSRPQVLDE